MMDAGNDLDILIAEKVFGYTLDYEFADLNFGGRPCVRELRTQDDEWGILPYYSTEIGDAWLVVEHLRNHYDCFVSVSVLPRVFARRGAASCVITGGDLAYPTPALTISEYAPTAPLAICRAAFEVLS